MDHLHFRRLIDAIRDILKKEGPMSVKSLYKQIKGKPSFDEKICGTSKEDFINFLQDVPYVFDIQHPQCTVHLCAIQGATATITHVAPWSYFCFASLVDSKEQTIHIPFKTFRNLDDSKHPIQKGEIVTVDAYGIDPRELPRIYQIFARWRSTNTTIVKKQKIATTDSKHSTKSSQSSHQIVFDPNNPKPMLDRIRRCLRDRGPLSIQSLCGYFYGKNPSQVKQIIKTFPNVFEVIGSKDIVHLRTKFGAMAKVINVFKNQCLAAVDDESVLVPHNSFPSDVRESNETLFNYLRPGDMIKVDIEGQDQSDYEPTVTFPPKWKAKTALLVTGSKGTPNSEKKTTQEDTPSCVETIYTQRDSSSVETKPQLCAGENVTESGRNAEKQFFEALKSTDEGTHRDSDTELLPNSKKSYGEIDQLQQPCRLSDKEMIIKLRDFILEQGPTVVDDLWEKLHWLKSDTALLSKEALETFIRNAPKALVIMKPDGMVQLKELVNAMATITAVHERYYIASLNQYPEEEICIPFQTVQVKDGQLSPSHSSHIGCMLTVDVYGRDPREMLSTSCKITEWCSTKAVLTGEGPSDGGTETEDKQIKAVLTVEGASDGGTEREDKQTKAVLTVGGPSDGGTEREDKQTKAVLTGEGPSDGGTEREDKQTKAVLTGEGLSDGGTLTEDKQTKAVLTGEGPSDGGAEAEDKLTKAVLIGDGPSDGGAEAEDKQTKAVLTGEGPSDGGAEAEDKLTKAVLICDGPSDGGAEAEDKQTKPVLTGEGPSDGGAEAEDKLTKAVLICDGPSDGGAEAEDKLTKAVLIGEGPSDGGTEREDKQTKAVLICDGPSDGGAEREDKQSKASTGEGHSVSVSNTLHGTKKPDSLLIESTRKQTKAMLNRLRLYLRGKGPVPMSALYGRIHGKKKDEVWEIIHQFPDVFEVTTPQNTVNLRAQFEVRAKVVSVSSDYCLAVNEDGNKEEALVTLNAFQPDVKHTDEVIRDVLKPGDLIKIDIEGQDRNEYESGATVTPKWKARKAFLVQVGTESECREQNNNTLSDVQGDAESMETDNSPISNNKTEQTQTNSSEAYYKLSDKELITSLRDMLLEQGPNTIDDLKRKLCKSKSHMGLINKEVLEKFLRSAPNVFIVQSNEVVYLKELTNTHGVIIKVFHGPEFCIASLSDFPNQTIYIPFQSVEPHNEEHTPLGLPFGIGSMITVSGYGRDPRELSSPETTFAEWYATKVVLRNATDGDLASENVTKPCELQNEQFKKSNCGAITGIDKENSQDARNMEPVPTERTTTHNVNVPMAPSSYIQASPNTADASCQTKPGVPEFQVVSNTADAGCQTEPTGPELQAVENTDASCQTELTGCELQVVENTAGVGCQTELTGHVVGTMYFRGIS